MNIQSYVEKIKLEFPKKQVTTKQKESQAFALTSDSSAQSFESLSSFLICRPTNTPSFILASDKFGNIVFRQAKALILFFLCNTLTECLKRPSFICNGASIILSFSINGLYIVLAYSYLRFCAVVDFRCSAGKVFHFF